MSIRIIPILVAAGLAVTSRDEVRGDEKLSLPMSPPPVFGIARLNKGGKIELEQMVAKSVAEKRAKVVVRDGRKVTVEYTVYRLVHERISSQLEIKYLAASITPDKKLDAENLRDELAKPRPALLTTDGRPLDPYFVRLLKPGTLILVNTRIKAVPPPPDTLVPPPSRPRVKKFPPRKGVKPLPRTAP